MNTGLDKELHRMNIIIMEDSSSLGLMRERPPLFTDSDQGRVETTSPKSQHVVRSLNVEICK